MNENEDGPKTPEVYAAADDWREALGIELTEALRRENRREAEGALRRAALAQRRRAGAAEDDKEEGGKTLHGIVEAYWKVAEEKPDLRPPTRQEVADELTINRRTLYGLVKKNGIPWPPPRPPKPAP